MNFQLHTSESAPDGAKATLLAIEQRYGFIPNLAAVFAESPGAFQGLLGLIMAFDDDALTLEPLERQIVLLAAAVENRCDYCTAAHSMLASNMGVERDQIDRLQTQSSLADARLEALRLFTTDLVNSRGHIDPANLDAFLVSGFTNAQVFEVLLGIALKTLTNYANHIARPPVNAQFREFLPNWDQAA